jgi:hypothetical protein
MGWRRRLGIALALVGAVGLTLWVARSGEGDGKAGVEIVSSTVDPRPAVGPRRLPCTEVDELANFGLYALGARFEDLDLEAVIRTCNRTNSVSYVYGECTPPGGEGGCAPPVEIQVWPACERYPGRHGSRGRFGTRRGVPALETDAGVELYSGDSSIIVFGDDPDRVDRAVAALQPVQLGKALDETPPATHPMQRLEPPIAGATAGRLRCS